MIRAEALFQRSHSEWNAEQNIIKEYNHRLELWRNRKSAFEQTQAQANAGIDALRAKYLNKEEGAVIEFTDGVLARSEYPEYFPKQSHIEFVPQTGVTVIDYELPALDALPRLKAVKYVQSRDAFDEVYLKENEVEQMYDNLIYQTCLRTIREVLESDIINAVQSITFNGWVNFIDKAKGSQRERVYCLYNLLRGHLKTLISLQWIQKLFPRVKRCRQFKIGRYGSNRADFAIESFGRAIYCRP
jgi:restriction system protein